MRLLDYLKEDSIFLLEQVNSFDAMIETAVQVLAPKIHCAPEIALKAVKQRELAAPTAIGFGCAIPHAVLPCASETTVGAVILKSPIYMNAPDNVGVDIVFVLLGNPKDARIHLKLLSKIARILHEEETRMKLRTCKTVAKLIEVLGACDAD